VPGRLLLPGRHGLSVQLPMPGRHLQSKKHHQHQQRLLAVPGRALLRMYVLRCLFLSRDFILCCFAQPTNIVYAILAYIDEYVVTSKAPVAW